MKSSHTLKKLSQHSVIGVVGLSILVAGCSGGSEETKKPSSSNLRTTNNVATPSTGGSTSPQIGSGSGSSSIGYSSNEASMDSVSSDLDAIKKDLAEVKKDSSKAAKNSNSTNQLLKIGLGVAGAIVGAKMVSSYISSRRAGESIGRSLWNGFTMNDTPRVVQQTTERVKAELEPGIIAGRDAAIGAQNAAGAAAGAAGGALAIGQQNGTAIANLGQQGQDNTQAVIREVGRQGGQTRASVDALRTEIQTSIAAQNKAIEEIKAIQITDEASRTDHANRIAALERFKTENESRIAQAPQVADELRAQNVRLAQAIEFEKNRLDIAASQTLGSLVTSLMNMQTFLKSLGRDDIRNIQVFYDNWISAEIGTDATPTRSNDGREFSNRLGKAVDLLGSSSSTQPASTAIP